MSTDNTRLRLSGAKMRERRIALGMTQIVLAFEVNAEKSLINRYEHGDVIPSINRVLDICAALGCRVEDLCEGRRP